MSDKSSSLLLHPVRREIYRIVTETPGNYFLDIANTLDIPQGTVAWHLKKLEKAGLVDTFKFGGKKIYFTPELRSEEIERAFAALKSKGSQEVFQYIINHEGAYQSEIAKALHQHHDTIRHHINKLIKVDLISFEKQNRSAHYFIGLVGKKILKGSTEIISRAYISFLFSKLKEECLVPELLEYSDKQLTIKISCPAKDDVIFSLELKGWSFEDNDGDLELHINDPMKDSRASQIAELQRPNISRLNTDKPTVKEVKNN